MALDPKLLEILACPEDKGPLLYFEDESSLYNPRLKRRYAVRDDIPIMLIDEAETVDDAEHDRLVAKAEPTASSPPSRRSAARWPSIRSAFGDALCGHARAARRRARGARARCRRRRCPTPHDFDHIVVLGMGGSGIAGDVAAGRRHRDAPGPGHGAEAVPHAGVRRPAHARVRALVLGRHRGDARDGARRARGRRHGSSRSRAAASSRELAERVAARCTCRARRDPDAARSRSARSSRRCSSCCSAWACCPRRTPALAARRSSSSPAGATSAGPTVDAGAQPGARARAQDRPHDPAHLRRRRPRRRRRDALEVSMNENAKAPAFWNVYPELDHNEICGWGQHGDVTRQVFTLVELRHGLEHPRLERRAVATREMIEEALHQVLDGRGRGRGAPRPAARPHLPRRLDELLPRARQRRRPRPDRRHHAAEGRHRLTPSDRALTACGADAHRSGRASEVRGAPRRRVRDEEAVGPARARRRTAP